MDKKPDLKKMRKRASIKTHPEASEIIVNIRLGAITVDGIKNEAERLGLPYQGLINSVLHRFITGELVDKTHLKKEKC